MFGKFLLTVAVIAIIWFGFRHLTRVAELKRRQPPPPPEPAQAVFGIEAETLVECRACGTWQPAGSAKSCGRSDCPY
ncbi:hypothetical protein [Magnetospirillum sp. SS-4]|uniref:hypothetical protein n=1 Tax=Magnetospirillum sp. SS-4 TaxID=2681465 RepID=UPI00137D868F|nr:hypothetical protein [Magnetospirillum sp. SS-4]CAA7613716.1 conserved hypothetical protein [Magnetospirillum sp. SS-4]